MGRPRNAKNPKVKGEWLPAALALQTARKRAGLTQRELAERLGVALPTFAGYELGVRSIPPRRLLALGELLKEPGLVAFVAIADHPVASERMARMPAQPELFTGDQFALWWTERQQEIIKEFGGSLRDLDSYRDVICGWIRDSIAISSREVAGPIDDELTAIGDRFFPQLVEAIRRRGRASSAAAA